MKRYFVKAPITGWHEVDRDSFERFISHVRRNANPTLAMDELIKRITRIEEPTPRPGGNEGRNVRRSAAFPNVMV